MSNWSNPITPYDDVIDSRGVIARLEWLRSLAEMDANTDETQITDEERAELDALTAFAAAGESLADWNYGGTLVRESHFVEYAQELAEDIGAVSANAEWPGRHIDWDAAADELRTDYTEVEFPDYVNGGDAITYLAR